VNGRESVRLPPHADDIVIGSSPLMILRALDLASQRRRVIVLEKEEVLGGAWYSPPRVGFSCVEAGVHLIENRRAVYRILENAGVELSVAEPAEFGVWKSIRIPLALARTISFLGVLMRAMIGRDRDAVMTTLPRTMRSIASIFVSFRYPRDGSLGMIRSLSRRMEERGVELFRGCRIDEVVLKSGVPGGVCRTNAGDVSFESFHFSSRAHCPIRIGDELLQRSVKTRETLSLLLVVDQSQTSEFSYVEIIGDPRLRRIRDVSSFVTPAVSGNRRVFCIQLRESGFDADEALNRQIARVTEKLVELGLLDRSAKILKAELDRIVYQTLSDRELDRLSARHQALASIRTTDFAEDMLSLVGVSRRGRR
jgi:hypothetical protein